MPKLLPTVPLQEHVCPLALVHVAVASDPTLRHAIFADAFGTAVKKRIRPIQISMLKKHSIIVDTKALSYESDQEIIKTFILSLMRLASALTFRSLACL